MELIAIAFMLVGGGALAIFVIAAMAIAKRESERNEPGPQQTGAPERERIAASLLFQIVSAGGAGDDEALRIVRRNTGIAAPVTRGIEVASWAESYARMSDPAMRQRLLETAVQLVASRERPVPLRQYSLVLDLSFGLGFQTDALARLREQYGFEYVDHAKNARPREADRAGGGAPLFVREPRKRDELLKILGISGEPTRAAIIAAYRKLATQHHPDRFHGAAGAEDAASRFIEITRAYEELLLLYRD